MVWAPSARKEEQNRLTGARNDFVASFGHRLDALRTGLTWLEEAPSDANRLHSLLRRVHALGSAAQVLGFATAAEVLVEAERAVQRVAQGESPRAAFQDAWRAFELLPSLVLGASPADVPGSDLGERALDVPYPISVLVFGPATLLEALRGDGSARIDPEYVADAAMALETARSVGPDVALIDADWEGAWDVTQGLLKDPRISRLPLLVIGNFVNAEAAAAFVTAGVERVLPKPLGPETLRRSLFELQDLRSRPRPTLEPLGSVTLDALVDRVTQELRKGLVESADPGGRATPIDLGEGAEVLGAVWGAVARLRELLTVKSRGAVRFQPFGPEGAIPLAAWMSDDRPLGGRSQRPGRGGEGIALQGRKILVTDDDPAVVWFMSSLFKAVGAEVLEAHDGHRALDLVFETLPDLVVSDVLMPGRDGFALCHEIKRDVLARDIPVILLSWKEDLLQRVRELGSDADGYLKKEAAASTVVQRVREVLRPRARVEERLSAGSGARGRLDGITPRFVLSVASRSMPDSTLTLRDAAYLYEVHLREGQLRSATRTAADGSTERGERVISALLGVSAGRFALQPDQTPCPRDFNQPLDHLLSAPVARARAALAGIAAEQLARVTRVRIDRESVSRYIECTPDPARQLLEELCSGCAPCDLLVRGTLSPRLLESVLSDLARRGAITGIERSDGASPFASSIGPPPIVKEPRARSAPDQAGAGERVTPMMEPEPMRVELGQAAVEPPAADQPGVEGLPPAQSAVGSEASGASEDPTGIGARFSTEGQAELEAREAPELALTGSETAGVEPSRATSEATTVEPATAPEMSAESLSIFQALSEPVAQGEPADRAGEEDSLPEIIPASDDADFSSLSETLGGIGPSPVVAATASPLPSVGSESPKQDPPLPLSAAPLSGPRPALKIPEGEIPPGMTEVIARAAAGSRDSVDPTDGKQDEPTPSSQGLEDSTPTPRTIDAPHNAAAGTDPAEESVGPAAKESASPVRDPAISNIAAKGEPAAEPGLDATLLSEGSRPSDYQVDPQSSLPRSPRREEPSAEGAPSAVSRERSGALRTAFWALAAFLGAFGLVRYALVPMLQEQRQEVDDGADLTVFEDLPAASPRFSVENLPLPGGEHTDPAQGLVEVVAGDQDQLYFDGMLVGRGSRRVTAQAGKHTVRVTRDTENIDLDVEVLPGRLTRVQSRPE